MNKTHLIKRFCIFTLLAFFCGLSGAAFSVAPSSTSSVSVTVVYPKAGNQYNNAKMAIRHMANLGTNKKFEFCQGDDVCGNELIIDNPGYKKSICNQNGENYKLCAQREECTALNIECIQNEINIRSAEISNTDATDFLEIRKNCNEVLIPACNRKNGISITPRSATLTNPNPNKTPIDPNAYGWFNEMCIVNGLERKIRNVVALETASGVKGKCVIRSDSPYLTDNDNNTNCNDGGMPPHCLCVEAPTGYVPASGYVVRPETQREAGLCIDIPLPQNCPGTTLGHADFPPTMIGLPDAYGICNQYWTNNVTPTGIALKPTLSCLNVGGIPKWENTVRNPCVRYSCPSILTAGPGINGAYQGGYGYGESGENIGRSNGFAVWPRFTKTNDLLQSVNATACIWGFKKLNSTPIYGEDGKITGYSGGISAVRDCNQFGLWQAPDPAKICTRIQCPAVDRNTTLPIPTSGTDYAAWNAWYASGGAEFPAINASRSAIRIQPESIAIGKCNNNLGFFQSPGGVDPTRECDYLGNWSEVKNPCVTNCSKIESEAEALMSNNGNAKWDDVQGAFSVEGVPGTFLGCASSSYVTNPYPPKVDINDQPLPPEVANDLTRAAEPPKRLCKPGSTGASGVASSVWAIAVNGCINKCPGADRDDRVGVGVTIHAKSNGNVPINWNSTPLGQWDYQTNWTGSTTEFNAAYFKPDPSGAPRSNGYYLLRRKCNLDGKWAEPEVMCSLNDGYINNAKYFIASKSPGLENSIPVGSATEPADAQCLAGYWAKHASTNYATSQPPQRTCKYPANSQFIDKAYLDLASSPTPIDCEAITCPPYTYLGPSSSFSVTGRSSVGSQKQGSCLNGKLNSIPPEINGVIPAGRTQTMTYTSMDVVMPTVSCQSNGTWSSVQNDCKRSCIITNRWAVDPNANYILQHNYYLRAYRAVYWSDSDDDAECNTDSYGYTCNDGALSMAANSIPGYATYTNRVDANWFGNMPINYLYNSSDWGPDGACRTLKFNPSTNSWCPGTEYVGYGMNSYTGPITNEIGCK